jgi:4-hydroxy-3-methylbut-2-enyl diphosphate reductase
MAGQTASDAQGEVCSLGPLIHNPQVVAELAARGVRAVEDISQVPAGTTLLVRSHGVGPDVLETAREKGIKVVDATCPFVGRAQHLAHNLTSEGYQVVVVGDIEHPEVRGIVGWTGGRGLVVQNPEEARRLAPLGPVAVVAQTTQPEANFRAVVEVLKQGAKQVLECNTICDATTQRQAAAIDLAGEVDLMVVVGGANSANTRKLADLCRSSGTTTYQIETVAELKTSWFRGVKVAGLTAGASTPEWIIEEVCERMKEHEENMVTEETVAKDVEVAENAAEVTEETGDAEETVEVAGAEEEEEGMGDDVEVKSLRHGEIVRGVVVQVAQDEVLVDVGAKSEGVIPIRELSCCDVNSPEEVVKVGDEIEVFVLKAEDNEGRLILSKEKADAEKSWVVLEGLLESGGPVEGIVREVVKGGLLVDVGVRAFLPASLVDRGYVEDLAKYLNMTVKARVIELNRGRRKVILSRKAVLEEEYAVQRQELMDNLQEGLVLRGIVRRLTQFGAFVDIGGVDGLLHISEMAWHRINHPSEVVKVGDELEVMVLRVDRENEKVSLGLKQVLPNPWDNVEEKYPVGKLVEARVVRLAPFGAFVQLEPGVEGLVHISHLADYHVAKPDEVVSEDEVVTVKVLSVDPVEKRIRLSIREVNKEKSGGGDGGGRRREREYQPKVQEPENDGGGATIGEMVGDIFEDKK